MAIRVVLPRVVTEKGVRGNVIRIGLIVVAVVFGVLFSVAGYYYFRYGSIVDERLKHPIFETTAKIYAAPRELRPGQKLTRAQIASELREAGYTTEGASQASPLGTYNESGGN